MQHHHQTQQRQQQYPCYPPQPLAAQTKAPYGGHGSYKIQLPPPQQLRPHLPARQINFHNGILSHQQHPGPTSSCPRIIPYSLRDMYVCPVSQPSHNDVKCSNCSLESSNPINHSHQCPKPRVYPARMPRPTGALPLAYYLRNELLYPSQYPPVVVRPPVLSGVRRYVPSNGVTPPVRPAAVHVQRIIPSSNNFLRCDLSSITPIEKDDPVHQFRDHRAKDLASQDMLLHEPHQPTPLTPKYAREATVTLSGVSTTASFGSSSSDQHPPLQPHEDKSFLDCNLRVPRLTKPQLTSPSNSGSHCKLDGKAKRLSNRSCASYRTRSCHASSVSCTPSMDNRPNTKERQDKQHTAAKVVTRYLVSETYKKQFDGTWVGLGIEEIPQQPQQAEDQTINGISSSYASVSSRHRGQQHIEATHDSGKRHDTIISLPVPPCPAPMSTQAKLSHQEIYRSITTTAQRSMSGDSQSAYRNKHPSAMTQKEAVTKDHDHPGPPSPRDLEAAISCAVASAEEKMKHSIPSPRLQTHRARMQLELTAMERMMTGTGKEGRVEEGRVCQTARPRKAVRLNSRRTNGSPKSTDIIRRMGKDNPSTSSPSLWMDTSVTKDLFYRSPDIVLSSTSSSSISCSQSFHVEKTKEQHPVAKLPLLKLGSMRRLTRRSKYGGGFNTARPVVSHLGVQEDQEKEEEEEEDEGSSTDSTEKNQEELRVMQRGNTDHHSIDHHTDKATQHHHSMRRNRLGPSTREDDPKGLAAMMHRPYHPHHPLFHKLGSMTERRVCGKDGKQERHRVEINEPGKEQMWLPRGRDVARRRGMLLDIAESSEEKKKNQSHQQVRVCSHEKLVEEKRIERYNRWLMRTRLPECWFLKMDELRSTLDRRDGRRRWSREADGCQGRVELQEINSGTFCTVHKGIYRDKEVAVKCPLKHQLETDLEMTTMRSVKELRLLARARNHLNILKLYGGMIVSKEEMWIVTEFVPGGDLYTRLCQDPDVRSLTPMMDSSADRIPMKTLGIPPAQRLKIMLQLASALSFLHTLEPKIVHKDLKSNNILVDDSFDIRLCDFGDAEEIRSGESIKYYTAVTWQYAPPEIILSKDPSHPVERQCNESVDIWSLGCVLLELCYRPTPFWHLLERIDPAHHHAALQSYLHKVIGGSGIGLSSSQNRHPNYYRRFKEGQVFRSRLPHCLSVLIDWCLNFESFSRPTAKQVYVYILQFRSNLLKELSDLDEHRKRRTNKKKRFI